MKSLFHYLRRAVKAPAGDEPSDGELLRRFVERRQEAAFTALVRRHGPMVLALACRLLGQAQDAEGKDVKGLGGRVEQLEQRVAQLEKRLRELDAALKKVQEK